MNSQQSTPKYSDLYSGDKFSHWRRFILQHAQRGYKHKWEMIYGNLSDARKDTINKYLFMDMLKLLNDEGL